MLDHAAGEVADGTLGGGVGCEPEIFDCVIKNLGKVDAIEAPAAPVEAMVQLLRRPAPWEAETEG